MLTTAQAAHLLGVKPGTVRAWIAAGKLTRQPCGRLANADVLAAYESRDARMADLVANRWAIQRTTLQP